MSKQEDTSGSEESLREEERDIMPDSGPNSSELNLTHSWKLVDPSQLQQTLHQVQDSVNKSLLRTWRTAITGDPEK